MTYDTQGRRIIGPQSTWEGECKALRARVAELVAENGIIRTDKHADAECIGHLERENERLRGLVRSIRRDADEWCVSRMTGNPELENQKGEKMWRTIRNASASLAPITASAELKDTSTATQRLTQCEVGRK